MDWLLLGSATLYLWMLAFRLHTPFIAPVQNWLRRGWRQDVVACPWCFGFWGALVLTLVWQFTQETLHELYTPLTILAAATVCGFFGSILENTNKIVEKE